MSNAPTPAVIVMRHFLDLPDDPSKWPGPFCYKMPDGSSIGIPWRRLDPKGIKASLNYVTALPGLIKTLNLCPVSLVFTQDPQSKQQTQNPFDTVYPFLFSQNIQKVNLLADGKALLATAHGDLLPKDGSHSTLICWDKQTLWGDQTYDASLFLSKMSRPGGPSLLPPPLKAPNGGSPGIYVFTNYNKNADDKFDLQIQPTYTALADTGPQPKQGPC